jgi:hypothetical protein
MSSALKVKDTDSTDIRTKLSKVESPNLAIQRLRSRVLAQSDASQVITCYDRMHHKHNRS